MADIETQRLKGDEWLEITGLVDGKSYHFQNSGASPARLMATDGAAPTTAREGEVLNSGQWTREPILKAASETIHGLGRTTIFKREIA